MVEVEFPYPSHRSWLDQGRFPGAVPAYNQSSGGVGVLPYAPGFAEIAFYSSPTRAWEFLAGFLVSTAVLRVHRWLVLVLRVAAILALAGCFAFYSDAMAFPGWRAIVPVAATVGLLLAGTTDGGRSRILSSRPMVMVGDLSYGLYLWHWPALVLCRFAFDESPLAVPVALVSTFTLALLSYATLEVPFRAASAMSLRRSVGLAVTCIAVPLTLVAGLLAVSPSLRAARGITFSSRFEYAGAQRLDCAEDGPHRDWNQDLCSWSVAGRPSVFLVGDSHAWAISATVAEAAQRSGLGFEVWNHFGCPFSAAVAVDEPGCADWQTDVLETILRERPALVVIANRSPTYTRAPGENFDVKLPDRPLARNEEEALAVWDAGLRAVVDPLADAGVPMLLISTVPEFPNNPLERISFVHPDGDLDPQPLSAVDLRRGRVVLVEQAIAASTPGLEIFDPIPHLCNTLCRQFDGTTWRYYDDDHLTPAGADHLLKPLEASIQRLAFS
ncbi:MAG: acyltransferase family protein [Acidimicrobiales bacterium]